MKRFELIFTVLKLPLDYCMLILAGFTAYLLRFSSTITTIRPAIFNLSWHSYWPLVFFVSLGWIIIFALSGLYSTNYNRKFANDLTRIIMACSTGFAAITIYVFFTLQKFDSRFLVLASWILAMIFIILERMILRGIRILLQHWGLGLRRLIIIGDEIVAKKIKDLLTAKPYLGYKVVGDYSHFSAGNTDWMLERQPDEILFTDPKAREEEALAAVEFANDHHLTFKYSADLFSAVSSNMTVSALAGIPIVELQRTKITGWGRIIKRLLDIFGSIILLIIFSPILLIISLIILIETGRPIIYKNERVGQKGKKFFTLKFRSMRQVDSTGPQFGEAGKKAEEKEKELIAKNSIKSGPIYKIINDPRVTKFGHFIRRWSFDEIPQFWNVLKGEMSLVGPRPHQPREVEKYGRQHKIILGIKPGITGLSQISGRSDLSFEEEMRLDVFYMENWSLLLDIIILVKTPFIVLKKKGAV